MTVGQIVCGTKGNIIPDRAEMRGTIRTFDQAVRDQLVARLGAYVSHIAQAYRAEGRLAVEGGSCPAVVNPPAQTAFVRECAARVVGAARVDEGLPIMPSDDMSLFLRARPGCYFQVGIKPTHDRPCPHHAPEFEMNEAGLPVGLAVGLEVVRAALAPVTAS
jgi:metal-dependent amidase/aminoacylase/carboxypeptidase family protein